MNRTTTFVMLLLLGSAVTTHGGTILVQWSDDGALNLAATWSGDFDVSGYNVGAPTSQDGQAFEANSSSNVFFLDFVGTSTVLNNYNIPSASPTVTPPFDFNDVGLTSTGVTTATPFNIIWGSGTIPQSSE